ncbi:unnamed protein product [Larinioides sclopetarius]|uniref:Defensin n=1 Tax=Larinioides sclopetarius TaxID=280406 RepID=A0AAV2BJ13_9ARAC
MKIHAFVLCLILGAWVIGSEAHYDYYPNARVTLCPYSPEQCANRCRQEGRGTTGECEGPGVAYCICKG